MTPFISERRDYVSHSSTRAYNERNFGFVVTMTAVVVSLSSDPAPDTQASKRLTCQKQLLAL
jgi:hypothetical protein